MQLEVGKYYKTRNGLKVGPTIKSTAGDPGGFFIDNHSLYKPDGTFGYGDKCRSESLDIIAECTDAPASILSAETIDMIVIDSLKHHADKDMEPLQREAFRIVLRYYGVTL